MNTQTAIRWARSSKVDGYESSDGGWVIERSFAYTICENAHPMGKGKPRCEGGEEHEYRYWILWADHDELGDIEQLDAADTLAEMKASAETFAGRRRNA